ncbi:unnamed protein product (mitochondrion) [Plasmodiophora brassicae]|uniref:PH domain-containing protein n=1 Tax=Plasmodiophora brassicae TaxID=37360 RepID=A0A3P3YK19_PLABS|nr:unnamed protein product [Plasmodiophora brassicae]
MADIVLEGILRRRKGDGPLLARWKRTPLVIIGDHLFGFSSTGDRESLSNPVICVDITTAKVDVVAEGSDNDTFPFRVTSACGNSVCLAAGSMHERDRWHVALLDRQGGPPVNLFPDSSIEGYLVKRGSKVKNWKRRYFVILDGQMSYWKLKVSTGHAAGIIGLGECSVMVDGDHITKREHSFGVTPLHGRRTYWICAASDEERSTWIDAIIAASFRGTSRIDSKVTVSLPEEFRATAGGREDPLFSAPVKIWSTGRLVDSRRLLVFKDICVLALPGAENGGTVEASEVVPMQYLWVSSRHSTSPFAFEIGSSNADEGRFVVSTVSDRARNRIVQILYEAALQAVRSASNLFIYGAIHRVLRGTLHSMALLCDPSGLTELLSQEGVCIDEPDEEGATALHMATYGGHRECVEILIERRANVAVLDGRGDSCLHIACRNGDLGCVQALASAAPVSALTLANAEAHTPLWAALFSGSIPALECALALIRSGVHPDSTDMSTGTTPLVHAAERDLSKVVGFLLENDASPHTCFPLHRAAAHNCIRSARWLLRYGAPPNLPDWNGVSPIRAATSLEMRTLLLRYGARDNLLCSDGTGETLEPDAESGHDNEFTHRRVVAHSRHRHYEWVDDKSQDNCQSCDCKFGYLDFSANERSGTLQRACDGCYNRLRYQSSRGPQCRSSKVDQPFTQLSPGGPPVALSTRRPDSPTTDDINDKAGIIADKTNQLASEAMQFSCAVSGLMKGAPYNTL